MKPHFVKFWFVIVFEVGCFHCFAGLPDDFEVFVRASGVLKLLLCLVQWRLSCSPSTFCVPSL